MGGRADEMMKRTVRAAARTEAGQRGEAVSWRLGATSAPRRSTPRLVSSTLDASLRIRTNETSLLRLGRSDTMRELVYTRNKAQYTVHRTARCPPPSSRSPPHPPPSHSSAFAFCAAMCSTSCWRWKLAG